MKYFHYQSRFIWKKENDNEVTQLGKWDEWIHSWVRVNESEEGNYEDFQNIKWFESMIVALGRWKIEGWLHRILDFNTHRLLRLEGGKGTIT
jgi:hypothetical protein